jgi:hypothetical protein
MTRDKSMLNSVIDFTTKEAFAATTLGMTIALSKHCLVYTRVMQKACILIAMVGAFGVLGMAQDDTQYQTWMLTRPTMLLQQPTPPNWQTLLIKSQRFGRHGMPTTR